MVRNLKPHKEKKGARTPGQVIPVLSTSGFIVIFRCCCCSELLQGLPVKAATVHLLVADDSVNVLVVVAFERTK